MKSFRNKLLRTKSSGDIPKPAGALDVDSGDVIPNPPNPEMFPGEAGQFNDGAKDVPRAGPIGWIQNINKDAIPTSKGSRRHRNSRLYASEERELERLPPIKSKLPTSYCILIFQLLLRRNETTFF